MLQKKFLRFFSTEITTHTASLITLESSKFSSTKNYFFPLNHHHWLYAFASDKEMFLCSGLL